MRILSTLLFVLAAAVIGLSAMFQVWLQGMACGFSGSGSQDCPWKMPWDMGREDLVIFYVIPLAAACVLVLIGVVLRRHANSNP